MNYALNLWSKPNQKLRRKCKKKKMGEELFEQNLFYRADNKFLTLADKRLLAAFHASYLQDYAHPICIAVAALKPGQLKLIWASLDVDLMTQASKIFGQILSVCFHNDDNLICRLGIDQQRLDTQFWVFGEGGWIFLGQPWATSHTCSKVGWRWNLLPEKISAFGH